MSALETRYPRLGEQIDRLVHTLLATKGGKMKGIMTYISQRTHYGSSMVHRWRQGKICPSSETLEILVQIGREEVSLPREWGESLLHAAHHPDTANIVSRLWGPKTIRIIPCNLPSRDHTRLIGRQAEITRLLELLSPEHAAPLITIDGIGGVGKTALVLEVAYRCWKVSTGEVLNPKISPFDAIIFVSAKQHILTSDGIFPSNEAKRTRRDIIRQIASTLNRSEITQVALQEQFSYVHRALAAQSTLLIVDNMETMEDRQEIMAFLYDLPPSVKVIITTRERLTSFSPIRLEQLLQEEALDLIERESQEKEAHISREQALHLYSHIGGIPAALVYAIGQIASDYSVETVLEKIPQTDSDVARFCFEGSLGPLRGQPAHHLLMAMAMFPKPPLRVAVAHAAGLTDHIAIEKGLTQLHRLSLIRRQEDRYVMLPLTREYALSELAAHSLFEGEARDRWVEWYLDFTKRFGGKDWKDWHVQYDWIEEEWENLLTVFDWCVAHEWYNAIQTFWQERHLVKFAHIYGYWDDRLHWLNWLIQAAEKRGDWSNAVKSMVDLGSTLTLMGQLEDADKCLQRAWEIHRYADSWVQVILIQKITKLCIQQKEYTAALSWLGQAKTLLDTTATQLEEPERTRRWVDFQSVKGLIFYRQKDYEQAKLCYQEMLHQAQIIGWERMVIYAQNHLAHIAIAQDRLDEAETLLQQADLPRDKRLTAFHKYTLACFYQKKGSIHEAYHLAREALEGFERLGMKRDAQEVDELLQR